MAQPTKRTDLKSRATMAFLILRESFKSFGYNRGLEKAATLSYYGFFAMIPMVLILVFLASAIISSSDRALAAIGNAAASISPMFNSVVLKEVQLLSHQRAWGLVSMLVLFWSVTPLTGAIRHAFSAIFKAHKTLPFWKAKLRDAAAVLMILLLVTLFMAGETVSTIVASGRLREWTLALHGVTLLIRLLIATACAGLFYLALSPVRLNLMLLLAGSVITTFLLGLIGAVFGLILRYNPDYGYAFGSMKAIFLLFVWVYYCFAAVLFATEVMANIRRRDVLVLKNLFLPEAGRRQAALLTRFTRQHAPGEVVFSEGEKGREMLYVLEGSVRLIHNGVLLREMTPGQYFGEMAMLLDAGRTATAKAGLAGATLASVSEENFEVVLRENPRIVLALLKELALRLKHTNERTAS